MLSSAIHRLFRYGFNWGRVGKMTAAVIASKQDALSWTLLKIPCGTFRWSDLWDIENGPDCLNAEYANNEASVNKAREPGGTEATSGVQRRSRFESSSGIPATQETKYISVVQHL